MPKTKRTGRPPAAFYASENLKRLYRARVQETQKEFAERHDIGGQSMIAQILSGAKALPIETAPKLARALHCSIDEICPEMAEFIRHELVPNLGKALRRVAVLLAALLFQQLQPSDATASVLHNSNYSPFGSLSAGLITHWRTIRDFCKSLLSFLYVMSDAAIA